MTIANHEHEADRFSPCSACFELAGEPSECPDCGGVENEHGPECQLVQHWDDNGTCEGCGEDFASAHPTVVLA